jgi:CRP-like cAMP-binding protein
MEIGGEESRSDKLKRILSRKIIPAISLINGTVSTELESAIIQHCRIVTAAKDQFIEESGSNQDGHLIYFESGIARCYYYDPVYSRYVITRITRKDEVTIDINAYLHGSPRAENIQMLESGTVITITYSNLKLMLSEFPGLYPGFMHFLAEQQKQHLTYQHLLKLPVEERIRIFLDDNPGITTRINNDHIASYLNMNRTTFSSAYAKYRTQKDGNS